MLAAFLYAVSTPLSKLLLGHVSSSMMAALLYLGAGLGMGVIWTARRARVPHRLAPGAGGSATQDAATKTEGLVREDLPYVIAMVALDVAAPLLLMAGLVSVPAESVSLLNNFEIVATSLIALAFFGERISPRLWAGIFIVTASCGILSFEGADGILSPGSVLVLGATLCWGVENNCTNRLSRKDPLQVVVVKGLGSGTGALFIAFGLGESLPEPMFAVAALALGFVAYGLSIYYYVSAQRGLGAARTSAYYALAPFMGVGISWAVFGNPPSPQFLLALALMSVGVILVTPRNDPPLMRCSRRRPAARDRARVPTPADSS